MIGQNTLSLIEKLEAAKLNPSQGLLCSDWNWVFNEGLDKAIAIVRQHSEQTTHVCTGSEQDANKLSMPIRLTPNNARD